MGTRVDAAFIRRAVEASDLAALHAALYQASGDSELAELCPVASLSPEGRARLVEKAVHLLETELDIEASGLAFITDKGSVERNYYVNESGRLLVNTPFETAELYEMMKAPNRDEVEFS